LNYKEELKGQLAENLPGAIGIFAQALEGGDTNKLMAGMKAGKYKAADLAIVSEEMKRRAAPVLEKARGSLAAQQGRLGNTMDSLVARQNSQGLNQGFATFLMGLNNGLDKFTSSTDALANMLTSLSIAGGRLAEYTLPMFDTWIEALSIKLSKISFLSPATPEEKKAEFMRYSQDRAVNDQAAWKAGLDSHFGLMTGLDPSKATPEQIAEGMKKMSPLYRSSFTKDGVKERSKYSKDEMIGDLLANLGVFLGGSLLTGGAAAPGLLAAMGTKSLVDIGRYKADQVTGGESIGEKLTKAKYQKVQRITDDWGNEMFDVKISIAPAGHSNVVTEAFNP
jgi:hypothetical protein